MRQLQKNILISMHWQNTFGFNIDFRKDNNYSLFHRCGDWPYSQAYFSDMERDRCHWLEMSGVRISVWISNFIHFLELIYHIWSSVGQSKGYREVSSFRLLDHVVRACTCGRIFLSSETMENVICIPAPKRFIGYSRVQIAATQHKN